MPATFTAIAWLVTFLFLKETVKTPVSVSSILKLRKGKNGADTKPQIAGDSIMDLPEPDKPLSLKALLTPRVLVAAGNYATLSLVDIAFRAIQPLFFSTPIALGGLGLPPPAIGNILSLYGVFNGIIQVFFFARIHDYFGSKKTFVGGMLCAFPSFIAFPVINYMARAQGLGTAVWVAVGVQTFISIGMTLSYGAIFIFIAAASPNRASLGATNGLSQMTVSIMRAIGPAMSNSLFSLSIEKGYLNGYLVYYVLILVVSGAMVIASMLPRKLWSQ